MTDLIVCLIVSAFALISLNTGVNAQCSHSYLDRIQKEKHLLFKPSEKCRETVSQHGCEGSVECTDGFYPSATTATLRCLNSQWNLGPRNFKCLPGCHILDLDDPQQLGNATIQSQSLQPVTTPNGQKYWPAGTIVETTCKKGYLFDTPEKRSARVDRHNCLGGESGWSNELNKTDIGSRPGLCPQVCQIPPGTMFSIPPQKCDVIEMDKERYTLQGSHFEVQLPNGRTSVEITCLNTNEKQISSPDRPNETPITIHGAGLSSLADMTIPESQRRIDSNPLHSQAPVQPAFVYPFLPAQNIQYLFPSPGVPVIQQNYAGLNPLLPLKLQQPPYLLNPPFLQLPQYIQSPQIPLVQEVSPLIVSVLQPPQQAPVRYAPLDKLAELGPPSVAIVNPPPSINSAYQQPRLGVLIQSLPVPNLPLEVIDEPRGPGVYLPISGLLSWMEVPLLANVRF